MSEGAPIPSLNPVPTSLLDQFLQELLDLGLTDRQVEGHLVFIRLWQKYLQPARHDPTLKRFPNAHELE